MDEQETTERRHLYANARIKELENKLRYKIDTELEDLPELVSGVNPELTRVRLKNLIGLLKELGIKS